LPIENPFSVHEKDLHESLITFKSGSNRKADNDCATSLFGHFISSSSEMAQIESILAEWNPAGEIFPVS